MSFRFALAVAIGLALHSFPGAAPTFAQESAMQGTLPDSIVITASRLPEDARLTGRRITVWTAEDIRRAPVASFDELLRIVGGAEVLSRGAFGVQSDITMRGSTFNGVLVLVDGARLNDPMTGHFLSNLPLPLSEIARIEVLRGPATALYGPDAIGGVIQIFTWASLREVSDSSNTIAGQAMLQRGEHGLYHLDAGGYTVGRRTAVSAATAWQGSEGAPIVNEEGDAIWGSRGPLQTDFERQSVTGAFVHGFEDMKVYARIGLDDRAFNAYHFYTPFPSDTAREETATAWAQIQLRSEAGARTSWSVQVVGRQLDDTYRYNPRTPINKHRTRSLMLQAQVAQAVRPDLTLIGGILSGIRAIDSNNLGKHDDRSAGAFGFAQWTVFKPLTVNAGLRVEFDQAYGAEATPQLNLAYNLPRATLRGGVSRAVRAPSYAERYFNTMLPSPPRDGNLGNPDLSAERAWAYEAGFDLYPTDAASVHGTLFRRNTSNLIDYAILTAQDSFFVAQNILKVHTTGVEVDGRLRFEVIGMPVTLVGSYTWLDAGIGDAGAAHGYKYALTNARHLAQGYATIGIDDFVVTTQGLWKDPLSSDPYGLVDLRVMYPWDTGRYRLTFTVEIRNLFDQVYTEVFDAPMPRRWILGGIKVQRL